MKGMMAKPASSKMTRAEVKAEYQAAKAAGTLPPMSEAEYVLGKSKPATATSQVTREEVKAEAKAANATKPVPPKTETK